MHVADAILSSTLDVALRGIAVGNGWIDPQKHFASYLDFAVKVGVLEEGSAVGLICSVVDITDLMLPFTALQGSQETDR